MPRYDKGVYDIIITSMEGAGGDNVHLEYRKSCSQIPGLKEAELRAASTGKAIKVTPDLIRITSESSKRAMTDTLEDGVN